MSERLLSAGQASDWVCRQGGSGSSESLPKGLVLLLAKLCAFLESQGVVKVMEVLAAVFPGQGAGSGGEQPPAFVAGEVARSVPFPIYPHSFPHFPLHLFLPSLQ